ncbi:MAG: hypothetical protein IJA91_02340 [Clostridia bacterium]|nr:hypothetical protein [Clostridia bacterium]
MKKTAMILAGILLCAAMTACAPTGGETSESTGPADTVATTEAATKTDAETEHEHTATGEWDRNTKEHWQVCEDGEKLNVGAHVSDEEGLCSICNSMIYEYDDGTSDVNTYDEHGDPIRYTLYNADGSVSYETFTEYAVDADGNRYEVKTTDYDHTNGMIYTVAYNEYGDPTGRTVSDMEGNVEQVDCWEREYNAEGDPIWEKSYTNDVLVQEITGYKTVVLDDVSMRFPETVIDYYDDGTKLVSVNGDNGEVAKETYYKADGTVEKELTHTYEYDSEGNPTSIKVYQGERLVYETEYALDADGWIYVTKETEYHEDGSKTVYEYDANGALVSESQYDAEGNLIQ